MTETSVYVGQSDFLICAIRDYLYVFSANANKYLDDMIVLYGSTPTAKEKFEKGLIKLGNDLYENYRMKYPGSQVAQISLRVSNSLYAAIRVAMDYLGVGSQEFCRIALCAYLSKKCPVSFDVFELKRRADRLDDHAHSTSTSPDDLYNKILNSMGGR